MKKDPANPISRTIELLSGQPAGTLLDVGTGAGELAHAMLEHGFTVTACDIYEKDFRYHGIIPFVRLNLDAEWPFTDGRFEYVVCLEVIEHLANPSQLIQALAAAIKPGGLLVLSTPNILSLKSRLRFLTEGAWEYFREPLLERAQIEYANPNEHFHIAPLRIHEIEFFLYTCGLRVETIETTKLYTGLRKVLFPIELLIRLQTFLKCFRTDRKGNISYRRISRLMLSPPLLYGQHLMVLARKARIPSRAPADTSPMGSVPETKSL